MKKETLLRFHRVYNILICISLFLAAACLIWGCLSIYFSGDKPYSPEAVSERFAKISVPVYVCLALSAFGVIFSAVFPVLPQKQKTKKAHNHTLERLSDKKDLAADSGIRNAVLRERNRRKNLFCLLACITAVASILFLVYALNHDNFHRSDINSSMIRAMWVLIPCLAVPFALGLFSAFYDRKSIEREIVLLKRLPDKAEPEKSLNGADGGETAVLAVRILLLCAGLGIAIYGFAAGGVADVLTKAINICTECIGLG